VDFDQNWPIILIDSNLSLEGAMKVVFAICLY